MICKRGRSQSWVPNRISVQRAGLHALIVRGLGEGGSGTLVGVVREVGRGGGAVRCEMMTAGRRCVLLGWIDVNVDVDSTRTIR